MKKLNIKQILLSKNIKKYFFAYKLYKPQKLDRGYYRTASTFNNYVLALNCIAIIINLDIHSFLFQEKA